MLRTWSRLYCRVFKKKEVWRKKKTILLQRNHYHWAVFSRKFSSGKQNHCDSALYTLQSVTSACRLKVWPFGTLTQHSTSQGLVHCTKEYCPLDHVIVIEKGRIADWSSASRQQWDESERCILADWCKATWPDTSLNRIALALLDSSILDQKEQVLQMDCRVTAWLDEKETVSSLRRSLAAYWYWRNSNSVTLIQHRNRWNTDSSGQLVHLGPHAKSFPGSCWCLAGLQIQYTVDKWQKSCGFVTGRQAHILSGKVSCAEVFEINHRHIWNFGAGTLELESCCCLDNEAVQVVVVSVWTPLFPQISKSYFLFGTRRGFQDCFHFHLGAKIVFSRAAACMSRAGVKNMRCSTAKTQLGTWSRAKSDGKKLTRWLHEADYPQN